MVPAAPEVRQVVEAIQRSFTLDDLALPEAFRPVHLAVALIDAVFDSGLGPGETPEPTAARYCRRFGLARTHEERSGATPEEETLGRLVERYAALGVRGMAEEAYGSGRRFPGTQRTCSGCVLHAARALVRIGVERLADVTARRRRDIEAALGGEPWARGETRRRLLMYTGGDAFVWGDAPVRAFAAGALGRRGVGAARAVGLVRAAAWELVLAPRYVDHAIWRAAMAAGRASGGER